MAIDPGGVPEIKRLFFEIALLSSHRVNEPNALRQQIDGMELGVVINDPADVTPLRKPS
jgi:hypothetical protein